MVDTISNTRGIGRTAYAPSPAASTEAAKPVTPVTAAEAPGRDKNGDGGEREEQAPEQAPVKLEIAEDGEGELIYRFVDASSGEIMRAWQGRDMNRLRDYLRDNHIHLIDKKI